MTEPLTRAELEAENETLRRAVTRLSALLGITQPERRGPAPKGCCPRCRQPILDHFTLAATPEELENWSQSDVVCWRTRGDVQAMIDSGGVSE